MIYVLEHAIKRYKERFPEMKTEDIESELIISAIDGLKIKHEKKNNIYATIDGNKVLISRESGKDEIILTVLDRRKALINNNWWMNQEEKK